MSAREWLLLLARRKLSRLSETAPVWLPAYAVAESKPLGFLSLLTLALLLVREMSGEAAVDRAHSSLAHGCAAQQYSLWQRRAHAYLHVARKRFDGINRCC